MNIPPLTSDNIIVYKFYNNINTLFYTQADDDVEITTVVSYTHAQGHHKGCMELLMNSNTKQTSQ